LVDVRFAEKLWPNMQIWLELAALASCGEASAAPIGEPIGEPIGLGFLGWARLGLGAARQHNPQIARNRRRGVASHDGRVLLLKSLGLEGIARKALTG
jgi:hypothetical protein